MANSEITPLLSNATASSSRNNSIKKKDNEQGVRQHLLNFTPLQSFITLLVLAVIVLGSVFLMIKYTLPKDLPE
jgi:hypothetical protein